MSRELLSQHEYAHKFHRAPTQADRDRVRELLSLRRRTDWTEPHAEGEWDLQPSERVGED